MTLDKTCNRCLGNRRILTNAGTGLTKPCPKCSPLVVLPSRKSVQDWAKTNLLPRKP